MAKRLFDLRKEYFFSELDEESTEADPFLQFSQWFEDAQQADIEEPNAMVLSTSDLRGNVSARVVLLKGFDNNGFVFFSNYQSRKGLQIASNPRVALTFHWHALGRQVRVEGRVKKVSRKESVAYFNSRPLESRINAVISSQSAIVPDRPFLEAMRDGYMFFLNGSQPACPPIWGGYIVKPVMVEFWQGREGRLHDRLRYDLRKNEWRVVRLAP